MCPNKNQFYQTTQKAATKTAKVSNSLYSSAINYISEGFSVIPINKSKQPTIFTWRKFQKLKPSTHVVSGWFSNDENSHGITIIAEQVSKNLKVLDMDSKHDLTGSLIKDFCGLIREHSLELFDRLTIAKTVNRD